MQFALLGVPCRKSQYTVTLNRKYCRALKFENFTRARARSLSPVRAANLVRRGGLLVYSTCSIGTKSEKSSFGFFFGGAARRAPCVQHLLDRYRF